jgi:predicted tellurium resistance membrane protein TerC
MEWLFNVETLASLSTLIVLEVILGIDNVIFIAVLSGRLPEEQQAKAQRIGIALALLSRLALLASIAWIIGLTQPLFAAFGQTFSWRDMILLTGGLFLIYKATSEINSQSLGEEDGPGKSLKEVTFTSVIIQIMLLDIIFSLDSVITAVGMAEHLWVMVVAVVVASLVMLLAARSISGFIERHPGVKMLAFSFLLLIGLALLADGLHFHIPKGYIYAAMGFAAFVEGLNLIVRRRKN